MTPDVVPERTSDPLPRLADAHCLVRKSYDASLLAFAWYHLAPLPAGGWAVQYGVWCQGVGTADAPWAACRDAAEGAGRFVAAAGELCRRAVPGGLAAEQEKARRKLWAKIARDHPTDPLPPPTTDAPPPESTPALPAVELALAHRAELLNLAYRVLGDQYAAEDAVQDALLAVHKYASHDPGRPLLPWLRVVVRHAARAHARWTRHERAGVELPEVADKVAGHDVEVDQADAVAIVKAATWALDPLSRNAFHLCYLSGLTHAHIARRLGRSVGSVAGLICRVRRTLGLWVTGTW